MELEQPVLRRGLTSAPPERKCIYGIERGMIFWGEVIPTEARGSEQNHDDPSPWLVVSNRILHTRIPIVAVVPLSTKLNKEGPEGHSFRQHRIRIGQKDITRYVIKTGERELRESDQLVLTEQARCFAHERLLGNPVGIVSKQALYAVESGLRYVFGIP